MPGWRDRARVLEALGESLLRSGCPRVERVEFLDRFGSNAAHAREVESAVTRLRSEAGRIDIVAHSMGGLAVRRFLADCPPSSHSPVRRAVFLATPHRGTWVAWLGWGAGAREMRPGSEFLRSLRDADIPSDARAFTVRSALDLRVFPAGSARLAGWPDVLLWSVGHRGLVRGRAAHAAIRAILALPDQPGRLAS